MMWRRTFNAKLQYKPMSSTFCHTHSKPLPTFIIGTSEQRSLEMEREAMTSLRIVAAGRGLSMSLPKIVDSVLKLANQSSTVKIVYLGTATYDKEEPYLLQTEGYRRLSQCEVVKLDVSEACETLPSAEEIQNTLETAHVVMVSGGNTLYAMNRWQELGIDKILTRISESTVLCGGSTGAIVWFEHGHSDSMDPTTFIRVDPNLTDEQKKDWNYIRVDGLNFLPFLCVPHHDATQSNGLPRSLDSDCMMLQDPEQLCLGIDENAALVIHNEIAWVISGDDVAQCYLKCCVQTEDGYDIVAHAIGESHAPIPLEHLVSGKIQWDDHSLTR